MIELALRFGWEKIVYFDTDSIFCLYDEETKKVWSTVNQTDFLGGWGLEEIIDKAQFTAPKRYKLEVEGELTVKAGGINFGNWLLEKGYVDEEGKPYMNDVPFDEINIVSSEWKVQRAFRVKGGTIIEFQDKEIKIPEKYKGIYLKNIKEAKE